MTEHEIMDGVLQDKVSQELVPPRSAGMLDALKENLSPNILMEKVKASKDRLFEVALYGGIGFVSGFLLKKYSTYVGVCILLLIGLGVLHHLNIIHIAINWENVNEVFGIQAAQNVNADNIVALVWEWVKLNMLISISYIVGFFIGLKVG